MGPKRSGGEDEHGGQWEYAGDAETKTWHDWQDFRQMNKTHEFEYRDSGNIGNKTDDEFPATGDYCPPEK